MSKKLLMAALACLSLGVISSKIETTPITVYAQENKSNFNREEILSGNYASVAGTWKNGEGRTITINADGTGTHQKDNEASRKIGIKPAEDGSKDNKEYFISSYWDFSATYGGAAIYYTPAGFDYSKDYGSHDESDKTQDRLFIGQGLGNVKPEEIYYKQTNGKENLPSPKKTDSKDKPKTGESPILTGDFSSLAGTWRNGRSTIWNISADGSVDAQAFDGTTYTFKLATHNVSEKEDFILLDYVSQSGADSNDDSVLYVQAGKDLSHDSMPDNSEKEKERLVFTPDPIYDLSTPVNNVWYRISPPAQQETVAENTENPTAQPNPQNENSTNNSKNNKSVSKKQNNTSSKNDKSDKGKNNSTLTGSVLILVGFATMAGAYFGLRS